MFLVFALSHPSSTPHPSVFHSESKQYAQNQLEPVRNQAVPIGTTWNWSDSEWKLGVCSESKWYQVALIGTAWYLWGTAKYWSYWSIFTKSPNIGTVFWATIYEWCRKILEARERWAEALEDVGRQGKARKDKWKPWKASRSYGRGWKRTSPGLEDNGMLQMPTMASSSSWMGPVELENPLSTMSYVSSYTVRGRSSCVSPLQKSQPFWSVVDTLLTLCSKFQLIALVITVYALFQSTQPMPNWYKLLMWLSGTRLVHNITMWLRLWTVHSA